MDAEPCALAFYLEGLVMAKFHPRQQHEQNIAPHAK